jgi:hypothetical protein
MTKPLCDGLLRRRTLGLASLTMQEPSSEGSEQAPRRTIDNLYKSRSARTFVPIFLVVTFVSLVVIIVTKGDVQDIVDMAIPFVVALLLFIGIHRPMHTWPDWLFSYKP